MPNNQQPRKNLSELFRDYWHYFATVDMFAAYYGLSVKTACRCLAWGKLRYERECAQPPRPVYDDLTAN